MVLLKRILAVVRLAVAGSADDTWIVHKVAPPAEVHALFLFFVGFFGNNDAKIGGVAVAGESSVGNETKYLGTMVVGGRIDATGEATNVSGAGEGPDVAIRAGAQGLVFLRNTSGGVDDRVSTTFGGARAKLVQWILGSRWDGNGGDGTLGSRSVDDEATIIVSQMAGGGHGSRCDRVCRALGWLG